MVSLDNEETCGCRERERRQRRRRQRQFQQQQRQQRRQRQLNVARMIIDIHTRLRCPNLLENQPFSIPTCQEFINKHGYEQHYIMAMILVNNMHEIGRNFVRQLLECYNSTFEIFDENELTITQQNYYDCAKNIMLEITKHKRINERGGFNKIMFNNLPMTRIESNKCWYLDDCMWINEEVLTYRQLLDLKTRALSCFCCERHQRNKHILRENSKKIADDDLSTTKECWCPCRHIARECTFIMHFCFGDQY